MNKLIASILFIAMISAHGLLEIKYVFSEESRFWIFSTLKWGPNFIEQSGQSLAMKTSFWYI
jgi:hypothetical protein